MTRLTGKWGQKTHKTEFTAIQLTSPYVTEWCWGRNFERKTERQWKG